jgi:hypothetical protein
VQLAINTTSTMDTMTRYPSTFSGFAQTSDVQDLESGALRAVPVDRRTLYQVSRHPLPVLGPRESLFPGT